MELTQIDPKDVAQIKFSLAGDMTATVAVVMKDGKLEVITGASLIEAKAFQDSVEAAPKEGSSEINHPAQLDPHENEPGPPISQAPCGVCGLVHSAIGNITCICTFCHELREIVHSGACAACCKQRFGHYFEQLGTPLGTLQEHKPPWAN